MTVIQGDLSELDIVAGVVSPALLDLVYECARCLGVADMSRFVKGFK